MKPRKVILKEGKEKAIKNHHHWIFSGAILSLPEFEDGEILPLYSKNEELLGEAYFNKKAKIVGRMLSFGSKKATDTLKEKLLNAIRWRLELFKDQETNAYRIVNGEGDGIPGLIVDRYHDRLVIQVSTLGMEKLKNFVVDILKTELNPKSIYEKSNLPSRKEEGLANFEKLLDGEEVDLVEILENGNKFVVSIKDGQKTGFFLDHRNMRQMVKSLSSGKKVLNCFSYTGGFSIYASSGNATKVDSVDISEKAIEMAKKNASMNNFDLAQMNFYTEDVFQFLRQNELNYDLIILDPPAFAKRQKDIVQACRGYKDINRVTMQKMPKNSLLLTSSCSYHVDESLFQKVIFQAAVEANRFVRIIGRHEMAPDHPINICHPESDYLKSLLLFVE